MTTTMQRSLQQLSNDLQEDHQQLLQHTPGCAVTLRHGSLRARSASNDDSGVVSPSSPSRARAETLSSRVRADGLTTTRQDRQRSPSRLNEQDKENRPVLRMPSGQARGPLTGFEDNEICLDRESPALGALRKLPALTEATRECSVGHEGDMSPALVGGLSPALRRRRQLGSVEPLELENNQEPQAAVAMARVDEVAQQVAQCNGKVDMLATSLSNVESSMALILQRLGCPPSQRYVLVPSDAV